MESLLSRKLFVEFPPSLDVVTLDTSDVKQKSLWLASAFVESSWIGFYSSLFETFSNDLFKMVPTVMDGTPASSSRASSLRSPRGTPPTRRTTRQEASRDISSNTPRAVSADRHRIGRIRDVDHR